jgi:light-regulated signal transduction histidine kinase (bacteriophytochrome)
MTNALSASLAVPAPLQREDCTDAVSQERKMLEEFIYLVSHDVRACLRALCEVPQWIREDLESEGQEIFASVAQSLDLLETNTSRLDQMMQDLLEFSRVGRMQSSAASSLSSRLQEVLKTLSDAPHLKTEMSLAVDQFPLGPEDLGRVLHALLGNASKHHDRSHGEVHILSTLKQGRIILQVLDDGPGIEEKYHEKVVGPMTTLRPRDEVEGSGMGLAIANKVAENYGGKLAFTAGLKGRGLGVELSFPAAASDELSV